MVPSSPVILVAISGTGHGHGSFFAPLCPACDAGPSWSLWLGAVTGVLLLSGAVTAALSVAKGRPAARGFLLGLFFPLAGLLVEALAPGRRPRFGFRGWTRVPETAPEAACPGCAAPLHPLAARCPACGRALSPLEASEARRAIPGAPPGPAPEPAPGPASEPAPGGPA
jgi:hypothetical protein